MKLFQIFWKVLKCQNRMLQKNVMSFMMNLKKISLLKMKTSSVFQLINLMKSLFLKISSLWKKQDNHSLLKNKLQVIATHKWKNGLKNKKELIKKPKKPCKISKDTWKKSKKNQNNCHQSKLEENVKAQEKLEISFSMVSVSLLLVRHFWIIPLLNLQLEENTVSLVETVSVKLVWWMLLLDHNFPKCQNIYKFSWLNNKLETLKKLLWIQF